MGTATALKDIANMNYTAWLSENLKKANELIITSSEIQPFFFQRGFSQAKNGIKLSAKYMINLGYFKVSIKCYKLNMTDHWGKIN